jgi:ribosomal-protein-alanine N-acetyltransferase
MPAIRRGRKEDLPAIAEIQAASPQASHWGVEDYLQYDLLVAEIDGIPAGFLVSRSLGGGECELLNLAVSPVCRRKGVAKALIRTFLGESPRIVFLELRESNEAALNLYRSIGFQEVGRRSGYYSFPLEAGIVMKFHSC